jgi:hypothetical protein
MFNSGHGYTKAEVWWSQAPLRMQSAKKVTLVDFFRPMERLDKEAAIALLEEIVEQLKK